MALIDRLLSRIVRSGELTLKTPDGAVRHFGSPDARFRPVTMHVKDSGVYRALLRDPALGLGEMYMADRIAIDDDDIWGLIDLATGNNKWDSGSNALRERPWQRARVHVGNRLGRVNFARRAKRNVAHHYDLSLIHI